MTARRRTHKAQMIVGLIVATLGIVFLLDNLGYPAAKGALAYWPVILIVIGLSKVIQARNVPEAVGGSVWGLIGTWILLNNLHVIDLSFWRGIRTFWPLILVGVGLSILWRALSERRDEGTPPDSRNVIKATAFLGGLKRSSASKNFEGADATAIMGGVHLDLREASIANEAYVYLFAMWGGVELVVPQGWMVDIQLTPVLGGIEDKTRPVADPDAPRLIVRGTVLMGGLEVRN